MTTAIAIEGTVGPYARPRCAAPLLTLLLTRAPARAGRARRRWRTTAARASTARPTTRSSPTRVHPDRLFPLLVFVLSMIQCVAGQAQGPPQGGRQGAHARAPTCAAAGSRSPPRAGTSAPARAAALAHDRPARAPQRDRRRRPRDGAAGRASTRFAADDGARVLVLTGAGDAGVLRRRRPEGARHARRPTRPAARSASPASPRPSRRSPRSRGWCLAGGLRARALVRPAGRRTERRASAVAERRWGVPLIDGGTQRLPRIVGSGRALDLVLTGRTIDAEEAARDRAGHRGRRRRRARRARARAGRGDRRLPAGHDALRPPRACSRAPGCRSPQGLALEARLGRGRLETGARGRRSASPPARAAAERAQGSERPLSGLSRNFRDFDGYPGRVTSQTDPRSPLLAFAAARGARQRRHSTRVYACGAVRQPLLDRRAARPGSPPTRPAQGSDHDRPDRVSAGARVADGATASATFTGAGRDDDRRLHAHAPADLPQRRAGQRHAPAATCSTRSAARSFAGAGDYQNATRDRLHAQGSWYGYPENNVVVPRSTVSRASFPALAGYNGDATSLQIAVGCFNGATTPPARPPAAARIANLISRRAGRAQRPDARRPPPSRPPACWPAGAATAPTPSRSTPATTAASAASRSSTSRGGAASSAPRTTTPARARDTRRDLLAALAQGVPEPQQRDRAPDQAGRRPAHAEGPRHRRRRQLTEQRPVRGRRRHAVRPRRRSTAAARPTAARSPRTSPASRKRAQAPSATASACGVTRPAAQRRGQADRRAPLLAVLTRDRRSDARFVAALDDDHERRRLYSVTVRAGASRLVAVRLGARTSTTPAPQASGYLTLNARASSSLRATPARRSASARRCGCAARCAAPSRARGVPVIFQGRSGGGRFETFADGRANGKGRFTVHYRFRSGRLARAHLHVPREAPRRRALPVRARLLQARARSARCAEVPDRVRRHELLRHRGHRLHRPAPRRAPARARGRHLRARARGLEDKLDGCVERWGARPTASSP